MIEILNYVINMLRILANEVEDAEDGELPWQEEVRG